MSGIEIAGLVLGAIPIVIAAWQSGNKIISSMEVLHNTRALDHLVNRLETQHILFKQSIRILLGPLMDGQTLQEMLANPHSKTWKASFVRSGLRSRLGQAFGLFERIIVEVQEIVLEIAAKFVDLRGGETLCMVGLEAIIDHQRVIPHIWDKVLLRFKFMLNKPKLEQRIKMLEIQTSALERLRINAAEARSTENTFQASRDKADRIHHALCDSWCSDHSNHSAALLMDERLLDDQVLDDGSYQIALLLSPHQSTGARKWVKVQVELVDNHTETCDSAPAIGSRVKTQSSDIIEERLCRNADYEAGSAQRVEGLCNMLKSPIDPPVTHLRLRPDGHLQAECERPLHVDHSVTTMSLENVLRSSMDLSQFMRYSLCATLASSMLRLMHTPWLRSSWGKLDIRFITPEPGVQLGPTSTALRSSIDLTRPYLVSQHDEAADQLDGEADDGSAIATLGIMLLEIHYNQSVEIILRSDDLESRMSSVEVLKSCLKKKSNDPNLHSVIRGAATYCYRQASVAGVSLLDLELLGKLEEHVLSPLGRNVNIYSPDRNLDSRLQMLGIVDETTLGTLSDHS